jgi:hypothetical protein
MRLRLRKHNTPNGWKSGQEKIKGWVTGGPWHRIAAKDHERKMKNRVAPAMVGLRRPTPRQDLLPAAGRFVGPEGPSPQG